MSGKITIDIAQKSANLFECLVHAHTVTSIANTTSVRRVSPDALGYIIDKFGTEMQDVISDLTIVDKYNLNFIEDEAKIAQLQLREALSFTATVLCDEYATLLKFSGPKKRLADLIQLTPAVCWKISARNNEFENYPRLVDYIGDKYSCKDLVFDAVEQRKANLSHGKADEQVFAAFKNEIVKMGDIARLLSHPEEFDNRFDKFIRAAAENAIVKVCAGIYKHHRVKIDKNIEKPLRAVIGKTRTQGRSA